MPKALMKHYSHHKRPANNSRDNLGVKLASEADPAAILSDAALLAPVKSARAVRFLSRNASRKEKRTRICRVAAKCNNSATLFRPRRARALLNAAFAYAAYQHLLRNGEATA